MQNGWRTTRRRSEDRSSERAITVRRHKPDYQIALYMGLLMCLGLIVMYAIGPQRANVLNTSWGTNFYTDTYFFVKQTVSLGLAMCAFIIMASLPYKRLLRHAGTILLIGLGACLLLALVGGLLHIEAIAPKIGNAYRWFQLGTLGTLQPAELLKFGILIFVASFLGVRAKQGLVNDFQKTLLPIGLITVVTAVIVVGLQKDMGTGLSAIAIIASMLIVSGLSWRLIALGCISLVLMMVLFIVTAEHRMSRVTTFFSGDPTSQTEGVRNDRSYHIDHALMAVGSGGLFGVGIGNSVEATGYLPEAINDSVFAIMGETFGFVGLVGVLLVFTLLLLRLLKTTDHLVDMRLKLLVAGIFGWLCAHVVLNVAAMIGIFPLTGITLPLLSFGGTSMIFIAGALGLAFQLSRYTTFGSTLEDSYGNQDTRSRRWLGRPRDAGRRRSS